MLHTHIGESFIDKEDGAMTLGGSVLFALAGQLLDVATTMQGIEHGAQEGNAFLRTLVERRRWGVLMGIKTIPVAASLVPYLLNPSEGRHRNAAVICNAIGIVGLLGGAWNFHVTQKIRR